MKKKLALLVGVIMTVSVVMGSLVGCKKPVSNEETPFVMMSEELDGVFNPFFYTSGPDGEVVGLTQLSMFTTTDGGELKYGDDAAAVVLDWSEVYDANDPAAASGKKGATTFTFVIKNGIKFSDGVPLSIRDVLFNMYVYLDPVYTGSSTMYSTDIIGLDEFRTGSTSSTEDAITSAATSRARSRITALINAVHGVLRDADLAAKKDDELVLKLLGEKVKEYEESKNEAKQKEYEQYIKDYQFTQKKFREELENDFKGSVDAYKDPPYRFTDVEGFMYNEGYVTWDKKKNEVKEWNYDRATVNTREKAIDHVYLSNMPGWDATNETSKFAQVVQYWGTANELLTQFIAEAKQQIIEETTGGQYKGVSGIKALDGNTTPSVTVGGKTYEVAKLPSGHKDDGTYENYGDFNSDWSVKDSNKYQVLQIKINEQDPKAKWNFGFTVAPMHYYSDAERIKEFDIATNHFGVKYSNLPFMQDVINGGEKVGLPLGAGPYKATTKNNGNPTRNTFYTNNIVYYVRNEYFHTVGSTIENAKIKMVRYQVINQNQAISMVKSGNVHFATPQATVENVRDIEKDKKNLSYTENMQNGYGYIGINAGKIPSVYLRRAIMYACDVSRCITYYGRHAEPIYWPMSKANWAYPENNDIATYEYGKGATGTDELSKAKAAQANVLEQMDAAGVRYTPTGGTSALGLDEYTISNVNLKYTFSIAGASLTEHPAFRTLQNAADILNACGWDVTVSPDTMALSKLASGSLTVWAAAWSAAIDPDMYQVYHKDSNATSTYSWGYREMRNGMPSGKTDISGLRYGNTLATDWNNVKKMSEIIMAARKKTLDKEREPLYHEALEMLMDLAVELPTYQRNNLYIYNPKFVDGSTLNKSKSAYASPLNEIWTVSLKEN